MTPRRLRVYANRANIIDLSEVDDVQPSLNISLLEGKTSVTAAFSSINTGSPSLFFLDIICKLSYNHIQGPSLLNYSSSREYHNIIIYLCICAFVFFGI